MPASGVAGGGRVGGLGLGLPGLAGGRLVLGLGLSSSPAATPRRMGRARACGRHPGGGGTADQDGCDQAAGPDRDRRATCCSLRASDGRGRRPCVHDTVTQRSVHVGRSAGRHPPFTARGLLHPSVAGVIAPGSVWRPPPQVSTRFPRRGRWHISRTRAAAPHAVGVSPARLGSSGGADVPKSQTTRSSHSAGSRRVPDPQKGSTSGLPRPAPTTAPGADRACHDPGRRWRPVVAGARRSAPAWAAPG